ncbi:hypothetical protein CKF54_00515 [Psittacicella hinzii]|uniref:Uncharacterized protein n=1 Tax=Psittacicella hinzii TaxID=2028575 RepID=A0A3A1Y884_9GAMM|nr:phage tail protein [Psittacicella hinzii]RIY34513.1 hypothetical protein CKF54_00515 [Psittacicella hinzii]
MTDNSSIFKKKQQRELAFTSLYTPAYQFSISDSPQYQNLFKIANDYVRSASDILRISEPDALNYFKDNFQYTYYSEYGKAFLNVTTYITNVVFKETKTAFGEREDTRTLLAKLQQYTQSDGAYFARFYGWALAQNSLSFNSRVLDRYRHAYLNGSTERQNEILDDIRSSITLIKGLGQYKNDTLSQIIAQESELYFQITKFKNYIPNGVETVQKTKEQPKVKKIFFGRARRAIASQTEFTVNSLKQTQHVVDVLSLGPIKGLADGFRNLYIDDTPILDAKGNKMLPNVQSELVLGWANQKIPYNNFFPSSNIKIDKTVQKNTPVVASVNTKDCDYIDVVLRVPQLIDAEIDFAIYINTADGTRTEIANQTIKGKWTNDKEFNFRYYLESSAELPLTVEVHRLNEEIEDDTNKSNPLKFVRVQGVREYMPSYPGMAYISSSWDNSSYTKEPTRKAIIYGRLVKIPSNYNPYSRQYTGDWDGTFKLDWSNNPAWILYDILTDVYFGLGGLIPIDMIDKWSFYNCAQYCDEMVDGTPRWTFNGAITKSAKAFNVINQIAGECRANIVDTGNGIKMLIERPQEHVYMFSNANVVNGNFTYQGSSLRTRNKRIEVKYTEPDNGYETTSVFVSDSKNASDYRASKTVTLTGCTSREQAIRYGKFILAVEKFETNTVNFTGNYDSLAVEVGDVVAISDYIVSGMYCNGKVKIVIPDKKNRTAKLYFDYLDEQLRDEKKIYTEVVSGKQLITYELSDLKQDEIGYYITIDITDKESPVPKHFDTFTVYTNRFSPAYYRIISKAVNNDRTIAYQAQKYSSKKFDVVDGKSDIIYTTEVNHYGPQLQASNLADLKANLSLSSGRVNLGISWSDDSRGDGITYTVQVRDKQTKNVLFTADTEKTTHTFYCDPNMPATDTEILVYTKINKVMNQSVYLTTDYRINIPALVPSKPKLNTLNIVAKGSSRKKINLSTSVNYSGVKNEKNIESVKIMFSHDPKYLQSTGSERLTESNSNVVVITSSKSNSRAITYSFTEDEIAILKLQASLMSKVIDGEAYYYRPLYCKVVPVNSAISNVLANGYKSSNWGIIDCSFYAKNANQYAQLYVHNTDRGRNRLDITVPSSDQVVNVPLFANIRVKLNDVLINTLKGITNTKNSSIEFKYDLFDVLRARDSRSYKVEYSSLIGQEYEIEEEVEFNIAGSAPDVKVDIEGTSAQIRMEVDNDIKPDWIILDKTSTNWRFTKYTILWAGKEVRSNVSIPIYSASELAKKKYSYEFRCFNVYDFQYIKKGSVTIKGNSTNSTNIPNYVIEIPRLTVPGESGKPYHRDNKTKIRTVVFTPVTYRAMFTGSKVSTYREKTNNNRAWRDPENFAMPGDWKAVVSFKSLDESEQNLIKNCDELILRGLTITGANVEKTVTTKSSGGYYLDKDNLALGLKYGTKEDLNSLIYDLTSIEVVRNGTTVTELFSSAFVATNKQGEGKLIRDASEMVNIKGYRRDNVSPDTVAMVDIRHSDDVSSNKRIIKVTTLDQNGNPVAAKVDFTIFYEN